MFRFVYQLPSDQKYSIVKQQVKMKYMKHYRVFQPDDR
jgi:hypothetical protein